VLNIHGTVWLLKISIVLCEEKIKKETEFNVDNTATNLGPKNVNPFVEFHWLRMRYREMYPPSYSDFFKKKIAKDIMCSETGLYM
jgi:hypothetical protein